MMATTRFAPGQKVAGSPRPRGRDNAKDTLCRNVLIYGHCRYEDQGCSFNHEPNSLHGGQAEPVLREPWLSFHFPNHDRGNPMQGENVPKGKGPPWEQRSIGKAPCPKKTLNVDSPSFTPTALASNVPSSAMSSRAASAAPFTPRGVQSGTSTPTLQADEPAPFNPAQIREFTPQVYDLSSSTAMNGSALDSQVPYDPFAMVSAAASQAPTSGQYNPYLENEGNLAAAGSGYYTTQANYAATTQPLQYHLYAPIGPHREDLLAYQRPSHDFFMPEQLREELQKKSEASRQTMHNSQLPTIENYHSLVALDTSHHKSTAVFGYPSWVYKATSSKNGNYYCLRRLEGYRLTDEKAIRSIKAWKRVDNGAVVAVHDAFTTRAFGDSSLIFVTDYHPLSKPISDHHFMTASRFGSRPPPVGEQVLWGYIVQLSSAIKSVHSANLAVRCIEPSKVLLTDKNRVRFSACAVLDVVHHENQRSLQDLQQEDLLNLGKLILSIATNSVLPQHAPAQSRMASMTHLERLYTPELRDTIAWLLNPAQPPLIKTVDELLRGIAPHIVTTYDSALHTQDTLTSELSRELENGRIARLMMKLGSINERQDFEGDRNWSENGDRYMLKLFRDYVFHQVDVNGNPVVDLGHIIRCLNKLDVGIDEKILLTSRDDQTNFIVTYKDLKKQVASVFGELTKPVRATRGF